ncbi:META domain-containing protein [Hoeflea prorocentri]|uniref:META domain-containing protein n=1 Tax=Hoeflea prorocentri TaxID=1922333 RepID=A0A9X3ZG89_9HYPH|nr:META domain-containing protein [Hoeflea prorocentri]MCY6380517.1 META domain-containing protein [Hoeflea prorocentri]MDA5398317.1 META domain-containing protein [Hoeflea prorocentri]
MEIRFAANIALSIGMLLAAASGAHATADGPDFFMVRDVAANDVLNIRTEPNPRAQKIGEIPPDGDGIQNLGCEGGLSFAEWLEATEAERDASERRVWCRIAYDGIVGWVAGRFLTEGSEPVANAAVSEPVRWALLKINGQPPNAEAFVTFAPDGSVSGSTGCNQFTTAGSIDSNALFIKGPVMMTRKACPDEALATQEKTILAALQGRIDIVFSPFSDELALSNPQTGVTLRLSPLRP